MIKIESKKAGFRRCGIAHRIEAISYPDDRFTPEELSSLAGDPMLTVTVIAAATVNPAQAGIQINAGDPPAEPIRADVSGKEPSKPAKKGKR